MYQSFTSFLKFGHTLYNLFLTFKSGIVKSKGVFIYNFDICFEIAFQRIVPTSVHTNRVRVDASQALVNTVD